MNRKRKSRGFMDSSNPYLKEESFAKASAITLDQEGKMTVSGAVNKTFLLGTIMMAAAAVSYTFPSSILTWGGAIAGLIIVFIAARKPEKSSMYAPIYAACEGFFVGGITYMYAAATYGGIIMQAVTLTFAVFFGMLAIYKSGLIKVTPGFRSGIIMATMGIAGLYLASIVLGLFGIHLPFLHQASPLTLVISLGILAIASLNLLLDFDMFEKGEQQGAPQYMEWYAAMGLLITLVWIYVEILRILAIFSGRE